MRKRQQFFLNIPFSLLLFSTIELLLLVSVKGGGDLLINTYLTCSGNTVNIHQISKEFTILVRLLCLLQKLASSYKDVIITDLFARRITCRMNFIQHVQIMYMLNKIHPQFLFKFQSGRQFVYIGNSNRKFPFNLFKG